LEKLLPVRTGRPKRASCRPLSADMFRVNMAANDDRHGTQSKHPNVN
jgi:hypothetical protein